MTTLDNHVRSAQLRLWINRYFRAAGAALGAAATAWSLAVVADRLFALGWPLGTAAAVAAAGAGLTSLAWVVMTREDRACAAVAVDAAAGLKERVSSGLYCQPQDDAFARAVVADAQRAVAGISAARLIPLRWCPSLTAGVCAAVGAAAVFWLLPQYDVLARERQRAEVAARRERQPTAQVEVARQIEILRDIEARHPELEDPAGAPSLEELATADRLEVPVDALRREAIKKINRLSEQLAGKASEERFAAMDELKQNLQKLADAGETKSAVSELRQALASGDYQSAQESVRKVQEQLAKREHGGDPAGAQQLQQQLADLSKALEEAGRQQGNAAQKLKNAGVSPQDVQRMMEALAKKDARQLERLAQQVMQQLQQQGMKKEQIQKMLDQLRQQQRANDACQQMARQMGNAAQCMKQGDGQNAAQSLGQAAEMLGELEQLAQELGEMQAQLAELQNAKDDLADPNRDECELCQGKGQCNGQPCPGCKGKAGREQDWANGQGRGAGTRERGEGPVAFEKKKAQVKTGKGDVIGQLFVKGRQEKGVSTREFTAAAAAAQRDATDAISKGEVPRLYHAAVKQYFERLSDADLAPPPEKAPAEAGKSP